MKQVLQDLKAGGTEVAEIPAPIGAPGELLIATTRTLVSSGTERMLVDFGKANLLDKARQQPDKVRQVLDKVRTDGLRPTIKAVRSKLDQPLPMGYCNVGRILQVGRDVEGFAVGDLVASNGKHAEIVAVPANLCAPVPPRVSEDAASFTVIGAIALQGIRLIQPTLGEAFAVTGLGLIGLMTVQLLKAHGCRVLGIDFDSEKCALARKFGAETVDLSNGEDPIAAGLAFSRGRGMDGVIITASTKSNEPVHQAATMCRKRGRIVLVGVVGLELSRADFYEKELTFQVSCSYGPGRYDPNFEEKGHDYPVGFVRWTEQRNFEAVLDMLSDGRLEVESLISHRFEINNAEAAYDLIAENAPSLGIVIDYPRAAEFLADSAKVARRVTVSTPEARVRKGGARIGFVGAGNYATQVLVPAFAKTTASLVSIASGAGVSSVHVARKLGIESACTDAHALIDSPDIDTVVVTTRHDSHAEFVRAALERGKHVFCEKPLTRTRDELLEVEAVYMRSGGGVDTSPCLMVGFNRRFAPHVVRIKSLLRAGSEPPAFIMTVNAGAVPKDTWIQDPAVGGGRLVGEACHFIDLLRFLAGAPISDVAGFKLGRSADQVTSDKASFTLAFENGAVGTVHYLANGSKSFPKERLEVFAGGGILQLDNFRRLRGYGWAGFSKMDLGSQDKGQAACVASFVAAIEDGLEAPIPAHEIFEVAHRTFDVAEALGG